MIQIPGKHVPAVKNRSSKHLYFLTKVRVGVRSMSNAQLAELASNGNGEAMREQTRRNKKA